MILETPRLIISEFTLFDHDELAKILANEEVMRFSVSGPMNKEQTEIFLHTRIIDHYEKYGYGLWALILKETEKLIGFAGLIKQQIDREQKIELGYRLDPNYWGQGLATEAGKAICKYAFHELKLKELISIIDPLNTRSLNVASRIGMRHIKNTTFHGCNVGIYGLSK